MNANMLVALKKVPDRSLHRTKDDTISDRR